MTVLLRAVSRARKRRADAERAFRAAVTDAAKAHTLSEVGAVAGLTKQGVSYIVRGDPRKRER